MPAPEPPPFDVPTHPPAPAAAGAGGPSCRRLLTAQWLVAGLLIAAAVVLHVRVYLHAGGLWRDEVSSVNLGTMPMDSTWQAMAYDSFPLLWPTVIRLWSALGLGQSDPQLRLLGLLVGLALLAVIVWAGWHCCRRPPLGMLVLLGLSPTFLQAGDSLRAYGLGALLMLLTLLGMVQLASRFSWRTTLLAGLAALLAVHCLYNNAVLLLTLGVAAAAAAAMQRRWSSTAAILGVGLAAAVSMLPYVSVVRRHARWADLQRVEISLADLVPKLFEALQATAPGGSWMWICWLLAGGLLVTWHRARIGSPVGQRVLMGAAIVSLVGYLIFLDSAGFRPQPWYFMGLLVIWGLTGETLLRSLPQRVMWVYLLACLLAGGWVFNHAWEQAGQRMTNVDVAATQLEAKAEATDLIVVNPWPVGVTFDRYYTGRAPWTTAPPLADLRVHPYDEVKQAMTDPRATEPVLQQIEQVLRRGDRVWWCSRVPPSRVPALVWPPAPLAGSGWSEVPFRVSWSSQVGHLLHTRAGEIRLILLDVKQPVSGRERVSVWVAQGWKEGQGDHTVRDSN